MGVLTLPDLVDALSAPIQFMSQAEKRAKQMQEMGIDASDIPTTSSAAVGLKDPQTVTATDKPAPPVQEGRPSVPAVAERSNSNTPSLQNAVVIDKKKG